MDDLIDPNALSTFLDSVRDWVTAHVLTISTLVQLLAVAAASRNRRAAVVRARPGGGATGPPPEDGFAVGAMVLHPRFGGGKIVDRQGAGKNLKLTIDFSDHGQKKILPAYTKLQVEAG